MEGKGEEGKSGKAGNKGERRDRNEGRYSDGVKRVKGERRGGKRGAG